MGPKVSELFTSEKGPGFHPFYWEAGKNKGGVPQRKTLPALLAWQRPWSYAVKK
jgi:hypothetical protein